MTKWERMKTRLSVRLEEAAARAKQEGANPSSAEVAQVSEVIPTVDDDGLDIQEIAYVFDPSVSLTMKNALRRLGRSNPLP